MTSIIVVVIITISIISVIYLSYLLLSFSQPSKKKELQISLEDMLKQIEMLYRQKKYEIVENVALEYLKTMPNAVEVREYLAKAFFSRDKIYDAISVILQILEKHPDNVSMRTLLAKCYKKINQFSKAINEYKLILEYDSENVIAIRELAEVYLSQNQNSQQRLQKLLMRMTEMLFTRNGAVTSISFWTLSYLTHRMISGKESSTVSMSTEEMILMYS